MLHRLKPRRLVKGVKRRTSRLVQMGEAVLKARVALARGREVSRPDVFGHCDDAAWFFVNTIGYRRSNVLRKILPSMPPEELQRSFIGFSGDTALATAFATYTLLLGIARRNGRPIGRESHVLDFGCGWGRTLRFFMRETLPERLFGVDVLPHSIDACRSTNPWCHFEVVPAFPPSALPTETFDLVYLFSVFSHLSEDAHDRWVTEFRRILRPGGLLVATTWHRDYITWCERARNGNTRGTHVKSVEAFIGTEDWLARYDRGEFCHSPVGGNVGLARDFYGETCIPEAYVRRHWIDRFDILEYVHADFSGIPQNVIVARRR